MRCLACGLIAEVALGARGERRRRRGAGCSSSAVRRPSERAIFVCRADEASPPLPECCAPLLPCSDSESGVVCPAAGQRRTAPAACSCNEQLQGAPPPRLRRAPGVSRAQLAVLRSRQPSARLSAHPLFTPCSRAVASARISSLCFSSVGHASLEMLRVRCRALGCVGSSMAAL
jgi:hypothetical protein